MERVHDDVLDVLFRKARTRNAWLPKPVTDDVLRKLYEVIKWGPTSANTSPAGFLFLRSAQRRSACARHSPPATSRRR